MTVLGEQSEKAVLENNCPRSGSQSTYDGPIIDMGQECFIDRWFLKK